MSERKLIAQNSVALLAEGVDRNKFEKMSDTWDVVSPSSRRAWIEILLRCTPGCLQTVALLAEGVDRNGYQEAWADYRMSRPPRGGRG